MQNIIDFLTRLQQNNNREWFAEHKAEYKKAEAEFHAFVEKLIEGIGSFDPNVKRLTLKDCTYRIYRDTRFSTDKSPYKTHMGAYICSGGKKSGNSGYYFHIEPQGEGLLGGNLLTTGLYMPEKHILQSVREDIMFNGEWFLAAIKKAKGFTLGMENSLKRVPAGFPSDSPFADYLKLKDVYLEMRVDNQFLLDPAVVEKTVAAYRKTLEFNNLLNRAADYAREEMA